MLDSVPVVCITGQVASIFRHRCISRSGYYWHHCANHQMELSNHSAAEIPAVFAKAFYIARTGRPGPVLIDITKDAQLGQL